MFEFVRRYYTAGRRSIRLKPEASRLIFEFFGIHGLPASILSLAIMLFSGFLMTRLTKLLKLPNVTGYILAGILIGPYIFKLIPEKIADGMEFVTDIALAFIAFGVGRYFRLSKIKENGIKVVIITLFETMVSGILVTLLMLFGFGFDLSFSLLFGAIASATAPASTIMTIRQYRAKGKFVDVLLQVIATDNAVSLIAFSVCTTVVAGMETNGGISAVLIYKPVLLNIASIVLGILFGFLLRVFIRTKTRSQDNRLILAIGMLLTMSGLCAAFDISPLLSCMALGASYINICNDKELFEQISNFMPPILSLFFVLSGMRLDIPSLYTTGFVGVAYFVVRIAGKYAGAYLGAAVSKSSPEIKRYFALGLIPQAGVAIGLAILAQRSLPAGDGLLLSSIILSSSVLYEMIGPACAKLSLQLSKSIPDKTTAPAAGQIAQNDAMQKAEQQELPRNGEIGAVCQLMLSEEKCDTAKPEENGFHTGI